MGRAQGQPQPGREGGLAAMSVGGLVSSTQLAVRSQIVSLVIEKSFSEANLQESKRFSGGGHQ